MAQGGSGQGLRTQCFGDMALGRKDVAPVDKAVFEQRFFRISTGVEAMLWCE